VKFNAELVRFVKHRSIVPCANVRAEHKETRKSVASLAFVNTTKIVLIMRFAID
jgi:hypothetical protein